MSGSPRFGALDRFRPLAALLVVALHTYPLADVSPDAEFLLTRVLARLAVPFFLMATGQFALLPLLQPGGARRLPRFLRKTGLLYGACILLYLPLGIYGGQYAGLTPLSAVRLLLFDGTYYHLWYFPAALLGVCLALLLRRALGRAGALTAAALLYAAGLFGDSYYGLAARLPALQAGYAALFSLSSYTRNGVFLAPLFLLLGAELGGGTLAVPRRAAGAGLALSLLLFAGEALALRALAWPRHDSMAVFLVPAALFLYRLLLTCPCAERPALRTLSGLVYVLHPLCIVGVRGAAKVLRATDLLIENNLAHFLAVAALSFALSGALTLLLLRLRAHKKRPDPRRARAWVEVDGAALRENARALQSLLPPGCALLPALKADAYGHGAAFAVRELRRAGVQDFCVATPQEGAALRRAGARGEILVLGAVPEALLPLARRWRLSLAAADLDHARRLSAWGRPLRVHVAVDTGMHRLGAPAGDADALAEIFRLPNLRIRGVFTHLCAADGASARDRAYTQAQLRAFQGALEALAARGIALPKRHALASAGVLAQPECAGDWARVGLALYGVPPAFARAAGAGLRPVLSLKARVALVRTLRAGECAGYGLAFSAARESRLAVLSIGYADGLPRALSCGVGCALVRGRRAPIAGRICMDQTLLDVTDIPGVAPGDEVVLLGEQAGARLSAWDVAGAAGTIPNEILSRLGPRLPRIPV